MFENYFAHKVKMKNRNLNDFGQRSTAAGNRTLDSDDFFDDMLGSSGGVPQFGLSLQDRLKGHLPLPRLGLSSPWWLKTGRASMAFTSFNSTSQCHKQILD